jgi:hypothetical protein
MATTQKLVTTNFNVHSAASFVNTFANTDYFIFAGKHTPYPISDSTITVPNNSVKASHIDVYDNMIFAKRVQQSDVVHMIPKYTWTSNTFYNQYDHRDGDLLTKQFFVMVDDDTEYNVWKCLHNGSNTTSTTYSTISPARVGSSADLNPLETGDKYVWKYMYTITKTQYEKFATSNYIPITANTSVIDGATPGTIELIDVVEAGKGYSNYIVEGTFKNGDINIGGVNTIYGAPEDAVAIDDYYQGCVLKITASSKPGAIDQYRRIVNYEGVGAQKKFILDEPFTVTPEVTDTYEVYPYVFVWGDGSESVPAEGRAIVDTAANSIARVEMLNVGAGYRYGESYPSDMPRDVPIAESTIYIPLPEVISQDAAFKAASLQPILSPKDGHGSDPWNELGANRVCISTKFTDSESGTIPTQNDFRQVGLIKQPLYTNIDIILKGANTVGNFALGETVYQYRQFKLHGNVNITANSTTILKTNYGKISNTATIVNGGTGYNSTVDTISVDNFGTDGTGANAYFTNNVSGVITGVVVSNTGAGYNLPPSANIITSTGSNGSITFSIDNPQTPTFKDSFEPGDYVLVQKGVNNFLSTVANIPADYQITSSSNATFTANNAEISALVLGAYGTVTSISSNQLTLSNVAGAFSETSKIIGIESGASSIIQSSNNTITAIQMNDKAAGSFTTATQLTRLIGDFTSGSSAFIEDEYISQESLISYAQPRGYMHHIDVGAGINDDQLFISNKFGIFNLDPAGVRTISGNTSGATLDYLSNKYPGDFVVGSGEVLYYENVDPITRSDNKSEIIKIILEF